MLPIKQISAEQFYSLSAIEEQTITRDTVKTEFALEFLSYRAYFPYIRLRESIEILNQGNFCFETGKKIAEAVGPYVITESLEQKLFHYGVVLEEGNIPYLAPIDFLDEEQLQASANKKLWTVSEIKTFFTQYGLQIVAIDLPENAKKSLDKLYRVRKQTFSCWQVLEALD